MTDKPTFEFDPPSTSGSTISSLPSTTSRGAGNLFGGSSNSTGNTSGGLFGSASNNNTGNTGSGLFGVNNTNSSANTGSNLFGGGSDPRASQPPFSFGNFGSAPPSSSGGEKKSDDKPGLFGQSTGGSALNSPQKPAEDQRAKAEASPFSITTPTAPSSAQFSGLFTAPPGGTAPNIFGARTFAPTGSTTPVPTSSVGGLFGRPSTTPAGPPPNAGGFGASTGNGNIFGFGGHSGQQSSGSFGSKPTGQEQTSSAAPAPSQPSTGPSLFGAPPPTRNGGLFGDRPGPSQAEGSSLFAGLKQPDGGTSAPSTNAIFSGFGKPSTGTTPTTSGSMPDGTHPPNVTTTPASTSGSSRPLFGIQQPTMQSAPTINNSLFGPPPATSQASSSLFSESAPATATGSSTSNTPFSFGQPPSSSTNQDSFKPASTSQPLFSGITSSSTSQAGTTTVASDSGLFKLPPTSSTTSAAASTSTTAPTGTTKPSLFGGLGGTTASSTSTGQSFFGAANKTAAPSTTSRTAISANATAGESSTSTTTQGGANGLAISTAGPTPPTQSRLRNKTMDEILTRWASDLTKYTKEFKAHAETVAHWDLLLVENMAKISRLYAGAVTSEKQTASVEMQLTAVENQQNELDSWLSRYEGEVDEIISKNAASQGDMGGPDQERERTYKLAEKLNERLDGMGRDLESMIEEVNGANAALSKNTKADEPITQIVRILNSHLTQLQAIDQGTVALQAKIAAAQKTGQVSYLNGGSNSTGRAAVEDFYKSYIGRR